MNCDCTHDLCITRGRTKGFDITLCSSDVSFAVGDVIRLTAAASRGAGAAIIDKSVTLTSVETSVLLELEAADTDIAAGDYVYEMEWSTGTNSEVILCGKITVKDKVVT